MLSAPPPAFEKPIIDCLETQYQLRAVVLTKLNTGADQNASVYKAEMSDGLGYFVKAKKGHSHNISVEILDFLHGAGVQDLILPIRTTQGELTARVDGFTLIVYPFIRGQDGFSCRLADKQWIRLGKALRQIHDLSIPASIAERVHSETYSPKWRESVRYFLSLESEKPNLNEPARELQEFIREKGVIIHQLVDRAEKLAEALEDTSPLFVLCHSDIHAGNVLIDGSHAIYIVDWDEPIMAAKERDLMFIGGGVGNVWNQPLEATLFYQGYGKTQIDKQLLAYYRNERIVEDIAQYCESLLLTTTGGANRLEMYTHFKDMFQPNGVVEIALESYERI